MRRKLTTVLVGLAALAAASLPALAQEKVKIIVGGLDKQIYLPAKLTEALGFFKEEGLEVELYNSTSGSQAATALLAREVQGVVGFYDHTIDLQAKGKVVTNIVQLLVSPGEVQLVDATKADKLKDPANWKGEALGVTGLGSATDFLTRALAVKAGLKANDVTLIPVGAGDTFLTALKQGKISGGMTTEPTVQRALSTGAAVIAVDLRTPEATRAALGGDYPASCLYVEGGWLAQNKPTAQKLANAFVKTLKWIQTHSASDIADKMPKDYLAGERALYVKGLEDGKAQYSPDGVMPKSAPESVLAVLASFKPGIDPAKIDLSKTYTTEFVTGAKATQ